MDRKLESKADATKLEVVDVIDDLIYEIKLLEHKKETLEKRVSDLEEEIEELKAEDNL